MSTITNHNPSLPTPSNTREPDRTARRTRMGAGAAESSDDPSAFGAVISATRLEMGRSLGLRSVDRGLDAKMFEPVPVDPQAQRRSQAHDELAQPRRRDARSLRLEKTTRGEGSPNGIGLASPVSAHAGGDGATARFIGDASISRQTVSGPPSANVTEASARLNVATGGAVSSAPHGAQDVRTLSNSPSAPDSPAAVSGANTSAPVAGGPTVGGNPGADGGVARQVGQLLRVSTGDEVASARAATPTPGATRGREGNARTNKDVQRQPSSRGTDSPSSERPTHRVSEPTPFDELVRSIRLRTGPRFSTARLRLDPPELGRMQVDVELTGSQLSLNVRTESAEAARRVQHRVSELKAALEHHGIRIDGVDVRIDSDKPGVPGGASYGTEPYAQNGAGNDSSSPDRSGHNRESGRVTERRDAGSEIDAGRFWGGSGWFGVTAGRVDVRA